MVEVGGSERGIGVGFCVRAKLRVSLARGIIEKGLLDRFSGTQLHQGEGNRHAS